MFFQCCREHRSYANNKNLDTVVCPHCDSGKSIKNGKKTEDRDISAKVVVGLSEILMAP